MDEATAALRVDAARIAGAGVAAADPAAAVRASLQRVDSVVRTRGGAEAALAAAGEIVLLAVGKAAAAMSRAAMERLAPREPGGAVTVLAKGHGRPTRSPQRWPRLTWWEAGHPYPDIGGLAAAGDALARARTAREGDLLLLLLSGGASAMWSAPAARLTLDDLRSTAAALLRSGAPIEAVNVVRSHLSAIGGGGLARTAGPATVLTLAVSDVIGAAPHTIGSGPTLPDPSSYADALRVIRDYEVDLAPGVLHHLRAGEAGLLAETPKPGDLPNVAGFEVVLSVADAVAGAEREALRSGYQARVISTSLVGEARDAAVRVAAEVRRAREWATGPVALLWGGETTVTIRGSGRGGRNQELALGAAVALEGVKGVAVAAMGTDGRDGPTEAAGGIIDGGTVARGAAAGLDAAAHLRANDSNSYLAATGDLLVTGATGTNVNDLTVALIGHPRGGE